VLNYANATMRFVDTVHVLERTAVGLLRLQ
jgi:hypothetical protein